jgi:hypothetical protein
MLTGARIFAVGFYLALAGTISPLFAQTTVASGSIVGTVSDPSGAVISGAKVTITNLATRQVVNVVTNSSGTFNSGALVPGDYNALVSAKGFSSAEAKVTVLVGNTATVNVSLQIGSKREVIKVQDSVLQVNTEQASVQGVLNDQQIEKLPVNGRNFLDLAQLEPGVQIQDGANFSLGKDGFSSVSVGGRFGRTTRIEVDGIDVSDEIFGTTTTNIPASGIQEFQLSQASRDLSTELTTSGAINVTTRSGTNAHHGEASSVTVRWLQCCRRRLDSLSPFNACSMVGARAVRLSSTSSSTSSMANARCSMSRPPFSSLPRSSNTPAASILPFVKTISWQRQTINWLRRTCSTASVIFRTHSQVTGAWVSRYSTPRMLRGHM